MSLYFEDFAVGRESVTRGRTITEADVVNFAGLSGDFIELHVNEEFAKASPFGRRIAHGALVFSVATGLMTQMGEIGDTVIAFYGIDKLRFTKPVFIGDTIHATKKVTAAEEKGPGRGLVTFDTAVWNQRGEAVLVYSDKLMLKARGS